LEEGPAPPVPSTEEIVMTKKSRGKNVKGRKSGTGTGAAPRKAGEMDEVALEEVSGGLNPQPLPPGGMQASKFISNPAVVMQDFHFQSFNKKRGG
jgi:hypothetical protein